MRLRTPIVALALLALPLVTGGCAVVDATTLPQRAQFLTPSDALLSEAPDTARQAALDSVSARQHARWDSVRTIVQPALDRLCKTSKAQGYVCSTGAASDLLKALSTSGLADTAKAVRADSIPVVVIDSTPAPDTTVQSDSLVVATGPAARAELPRRTATSTPPSSGRVVKVCLICSLQAAIDNAVSGDQLLLPPGATYTGNFTLPNKGSAQGWIVIRTDTSIATSGRMTPSAAGRLRLARIVSPTNEPAIATAPGAHHWALDALDVSADPSRLDVNALVVFGSGDVAVQKLVADASHDLILARSYVHGLPTQQVHRCVVLNSGASAVVNSWVSECHSNNNDSQAIIGWNGPGPFEIRNNYLEGGHEPVMFGGADNAGDALSPADIRIIGNWIGHPLAWKGKWQVKTIVELKNARRVLIEGNVLENVWKDGQIGFAFLLKSTNQNCTAPWSQTSDVTVRYNRLRNVANGFNLSGHASECGTAIAERAAARFVIADNVVEPFGYQDGTNGIPLQLLSGTEDVVFAHNTFATAGLNAMSFDGAPALRSALHSNVLPHGQYGVKGSGTADGTSTLSAYAAGGLFAADMLVGGDEYPASCANYPATTLCPMTLPATLPLGLDGRTIGADVARVNAATAGAVVAP